MNDLSSKITADAAQHYGHMAVELQRERNARRAEADRAHIDRLIERLTNLRNNPDSGYRRLQAVDAASFVWPDVDFGSEVESLCHELRIDTEGYPLDDDGFVSGGDRQWTPMVRVMPSGSL